MGSVPAVGSPAASLMARFLRFPLTRISLALLAIAIPFAAVYIPLKSFVHDKLLLRAGVLLLAVVVIGSYRIYVRCICLLYTSPSPRD